MTTFTTGRKAEAVAAEYIEKLGYKILEQNYRTRWCEIDIVAEKARVIYFVEVKYRKNNEHGGGMEYITSRKLKQMTFAAESWLAEQQQQSEFYLSGLEVSGTNFEVTNYIESLTL